MSARDPLPGLLHAAALNIARHRITVDEYDRLGEAGVLGPESRVELIEGEVIDMAPIGTKHFAMVARLNRLLLLAVGDSALVSVQSSLRLGKHNQPEPDIAVLKPRPDFYDKALPTGRDALLVIEVADTTLAYDIKVKAPLYARHGVAAYWIVDLPNRLLRRFAQPLGDDWAEITAQQSPGTVELPGLPGVAIDLAGVI